MVDNENKNIQNAIEFYMLANRLKYATTDKKQSLADLWFYDFSYCN